MRKALRTVVLFAAIALLLSLFALSGCTKHPSDEELQVLEETKAAALAAEEAQADCESEKSELENQLAGKKQKLEDMEKEKEAVSERLEQM